MLLCRLCGRKIIANEVKYRIPQGGESLSICADCAKTKGLV
ncbi:MAG TPA: hypothetical protein VI997_10735 [Candidatus Thermoplasmatota archaeon]|nr:hypothetical protein [Candidatus Thermoplasmatota archaeon]